MNKILTNLQYVKLRRVLILPILLLGVMIVTSCNDIFDEDGGASSGGKGSVYEILSKRGNYNYFLKAADMTNYAKLLQGTGLVTVFAPDDSAFVSYLNDTYGTTEMSEDMVDELRELVGYHIIQFSYTPTDLEAFSTTSATDPSSRGDGLSYKFKTFSRPKNLNLVDVNEREYEVYAGERYIPVFSGNMFNSKSISNPSEDYLKLYPGSEWHNGGSDLYVGNAYVTESGIPTDNGYLYLVDQVSRPAKTIYETLKSDPEWRDDYSIYFDLMRRVELFQYSKSHSDKYAQPGDSLYLFYHYNKPSKSLEIPEFASEWSYHDEDGINFEKPMRNTVHCFVPNNSVLEPYIRDTYAGYGTDMDNFVENLPLNIVYHILQSHSIDKREITLPSELSSRGIVDTYGQTLNLQSGDIDKVKYCSNGLLYGVNKIVDTKILSGIAGVLLERPEYKYYSTAFNVNNMYQMLTATEDDYTLLVSTDDDLLLNSGLYVSDPEVKNGVVTYTFKKSTATQNNNIITTFVKSSLFKGEIDTTSENLRYYLAEDGVTYLSVYKGYMLDELGGTVSVAETIDCDNGTMLQVGQPLQSTTDTVADCITLSSVVDVVNYNPQFSTYIFRLLLRKLILEDLSFLLAGNEYMCFIPSDEAMITAFNQGRLPACITGVTPSGTVTDETTGETAFRGPYISYDEDPLAPGLTEEYLADLTRFVTSHFVSRNENNFSSYLLPSLSPYGANVEYSLRATTAAPYSATVAPVTINIEWSESEPNVLSLRDSSGYVIKTKENPLPQIMKNGVVYIVDNCFSHINQ